MRTVNMDKTIEEMLPLYATYMNSLLEREANRIFHTRYRNSNDHKYEAEAYYDAVHAYEFLNKEVAQDPKKYLYHPQDMIYTGFDANGNPGVELGALSTDDSVFNRLKSMVWLENKYCIKNIIVPLSQKISGHVRSFDYDPVKVWTYSRTPYDSNAEEILMLNQRVHMLNSNGFVRFFQQFGAPQWFAAKDSR